MSKIQTSKKFEAKVPIPVWEQWEAWLDGRGSLNNTQIFCGLLRLFLASPESLQLRALFGKEETLLVAEGRDPAEILTPDECAQIRQIMRATPREATVPGNPWGRIISAACAARSQPKITVINLEHVKHLCALREVCLGLPPSCWQPLADELRRRLPRLWEMDRTET